MATNNNPFKWELELTQHSPLIHFQASGDPKQDKHLLPRASELKPLINRFIKKDLIKMLEQDPQYTKDQIKDLNSVIEKNFNSTENGTDKAPTSYKVHFKADTWKTELITDTKTDRHNQERIVKDNAYFGDNQALSFKMLKLYFFSYNAKIITLLKIALPRMLSCFNMGTRKSKGFGSILPAKMDRKTLETYLKQLYGEQNVYLFKTDIEGFAKNEQNKINRNYFRNIVQKHYSWLKSGLNHRSFGPYQHSCLKKYFYEHLQSKPWEKAAIKNQLDDSNYNDAINQNNNNDQEPIEMNDYIFIRCLLGLAGEYSFPILGHKAVVSHDQIKRIPSPVMFKVFRKSLYAVSTWNHYKEEYDTITNEDFVFKIIPNSERNPKFALKIKSPEEFNIQDFLSIYFPKLGFHPITNKAGS